MVSPYFAQWVIRSVASYIDILWIFPTGFFQRFKTMSDEYTTVPTTRLNGAYTRSIDQGGVLRLIRLISDQVDKHHH
jgi:hypothetical protein